MDCATLKLLFDYHTRHVRRAWVLRVHVFERFDDHTCHNEIAIPVLVGGYDVPWTFARGAFVKHLFKRPLITVPEFSFFEICWIELPTFRRVINPFLESPLLFIF